MLVIFLLIDAGIAITSVGVFLCGFYKRKRIARKGNNNSNVCQLQEDVYEDPDKNIPDTRTDDSHQGACSELTEQIEEVYEDTDVVYEEADHQEEVYEETEVVYEQTDVIYEETDVVYEDLENISLDPQTQENIAYTVVKCS